MAEVQWIRLVVGMFDGNSFKKIKRAKIGGVSYRDKLTAVWVELLDLAGKSNANGYLIDNNNIPYRSFEDIATQLDREEKEIELCMDFFIREKMVEIIDDVYCLTNFIRYQNQDGLEKIREQNRLRKQKQREKQKALPPVSRDMSRDVTLDVTQCHATELDKEKDLDIDLYTTTTTEPPTLSEVYFYLKEFVDDGAVKEAEKFHAYNELRGWTCLPNWKAAADLWIARIDS